MDREIKKEKGTEKVSRVAPGKGSLFAHRSMKCSVKEIVKQTQETNEIPKKRRIMIPLPEFHLLSHSFPNERLAGRKTRKYRNILKHLYHSILTGQGINKVSHG
jgi:hypothetical protein